MPPMATPQLLKIEKKNVQTISGYYTNKESN